MKQLLFLFLLVNSLCFSQQEKYKQLDALFDMLYSKNKIMGSIAVMKDGEIEYTNAKGYQYKTEKEQKTVTETSKYRIGSVTKTFTATMIFQLVDEGKIALDDKLSAFFPEIPNASNITIANLLNHSSGLFNITREPDFNTWMLEPSSREKMLSRIQNHKVDFQAGEKTEYSNTNFILLGYILEDVENEHYRDILKGLIVDKLNLKNTYYGGGINTEDGECESYYYDENKKLIPATETHMSNPGGAGAIVSTPSDIVVFIDALFSEKLISNSSFGKMTYTESEMGSGIAKSERNGQLFFGYSGSIDGFKSFYIHAPNTKTTIAVTFNAINYGMLPIVFNALDASNGKAFDMPNFNRIQLTEQQIKNYEGVYENEELAFDLNFVTDGKMLKGGPNPKQLNDLEATKKDEFLLEAMGVTLQFNLENNTLLFNAPTTGPKLFTKKQ